VLETYASLGEVHSVAAGRQIGGGVTTNTPETCAAQLHVVICDDSTLNRECLAMALRSHGMHVDSVWDLGSLLGQLSDRAPDVILMNIGTPDSSTLLQVGLDAGPNVKVIVTGLSDDRESDIVSCAEAGVAGLHLRTESIDQLLNLIRESAHDESMCSPEIAAILLRRVYAMVGQQNPESKNPELTDRETQILQMLEEGLTNQQIASRLSVSIHTVKNHAHSLFTKLGVNSRAEAVTTYRAMRYSNMGSP
jgi:DNA-binding NarL/FixJ family response regulator